MAVWGFLPPLLAGLFTTYFELVKRKFVFWTFTYFMSCIQYELNIERNSMMRLSALTLDFICSPVALIDVSQAAVDLLCLNLCPGLSNFL